MAKEVQNKTFGQERSIGAYLLWFFWGVSLSFMTILSLVLLILLIASVTLNIYLGWQMSGLQVSISRPASGSIEAPIPIPTNVLAAIPTNTPELIPTSTPTPVPTESLLESQIATLSAIATQVAVSQSNSPQVLVVTATPAVPPATVPTAVAIGPPAEEANPPAAESADGSTSVTTEAPIASPANTPVAPAGEAQEFVPPATSSNSYTLIPINGQRDSRPGEEHGDLNLKLRDPQPIGVELSLVDVGSGIDPNAPKLKGIFEPNFAAAYTVHNWDWACNCKADLIQDDGVVLVGIDTTPGQPVFIPTKEQDIYDGKFYAVVLYASEDSLTFVYAREGTLAKGYSVHYEGLHTDPNLLAKYRESKGNELPGLTLDTPVGVASDELIVAIRDNGTFLDVRSINDWWK